ncbi:MAG: M1 family aminopeptidase [Candidatus Krumholzibacteriia bacterium]
MTRAMRRRMLVALSLGAALAAIGFGSCSYFEYRNEGGEPFLLYSLVLADAHLKVVHVRGAVFGITADRAPFRAFAGPKGKRLDPIGFRAADRRGRTLAVRAGDGLWTVENGGRDFTIDYDVVLTIEDRYSADVRDMMTCIGVDRSRILGRDVFLVPELNVADGILVDVAMLPGWSLSASSPHVRNRVIVPDCAELPFTLAASGNYRSLERIVAGTEITLAIADSWSFTDAAFFDVVCRIVAEEIALFGPSPRSRYLFVCDKNPVMGGDRFDYYGIHYGGSMILLLDRRLDRSELMDTPMAIIAHEFFHNWNGEALGPAGTEFLWFTEGVTNYYAYQVLRDARVITDGQYGVHRRAISERYRENPYARKVSIGDAANSDMRDKDMVNLLYDGGFLAAEALDARLRAETGGKVALIEVLKHMYENAGGSIVVDESSFLRAASALGGGDLAAYLNDLVHTPCPERFAPDSSPLE